MFSPTMRAQSLKMKQFLLAHLYRHPQVSRTMALARQVVRELFGLYMQDQTPAAPGARSARAQLPEQLLRCCGRLHRGHDHRCSLREHRRLTGKRLWAVQFGRTGQPLLVVVIAAGVCAALHVGKRRPSPCAA